MTVTFNSPEYREYEAEIEALAEILNTLAEGTGAGGGIIIGALTLMLAIRLDDAPENIRNEVRSRVVAVLKGHADGLVINKLGSKRAYATEVADWCERELKMAKELGGRMDYRCYVQNVDLIIGALREYAAKPEADQ